MKLSIRMTLMALAIGVALAPPLPARTGVEEIGSMTAVEEDGSVMIDERGYVVSPDAKISDGDGKRVLLPAVSLPVRVVYEFTYTAEGPVIFRIVVDPQVRM